MGVREPEHGVDVGVIGRRHVAGMSVNPVNVAIDSVLHHMMADMMTGHVAGNNEWLKQDTKGRWVVIAGQHGRRFSSLSRARAFASKVGGKVQRWRRRAWIRLTPLQLALKGMVSGMVSARMAMTSTTTPKRSKVDVTAPRRLGSAAPVSRATRAGKAVKRARQGAGLPRFFVRALARACRRHAGCFMRGT